MSAHALQLATTAPIPEVWINYREALELCDRTVRWMSAEIASGRIRVRDTERIQRNGRAEREVALASLPAAARSRYQREQAQLTAPVQQTLPLFGAPQLVTKHAPRVRVAPQHTTEAQRRQAILQPILAMRDPHARGIYATGVQLPDGRICRIESQNAMIAFVIEQQRQLGNALSVRTVNRWLAAHKTEGAAGLQRKRREDAGQSRWFLAHPKAAALVAMLYLGDGLSPGLSVQACYEMLLAQRETCDLAADDLPHYHTVRNFIESAPAALKVYARRGKEEFAGRMLPYLSRAYQERANAIWVADTMISDVEVMNDCIPGARLGEPIRLRLTAIIDYRSRYIVGYSWAWEGSSASIGAALRMAITTHGPCELFYCDNGKDFLKVAAGALPGYVLPQDAQGWFAREMKRIDQSGLLARCGIRVTHCIVRHPQSKHVERFFRTLHLTFCKLWRTYTGGKPSERPDQTSALMAVHRKALRDGDLARSHHPLASDFIGSFEQWVQKYHHHRGHRGQGMDFRSPAQVFREEFNPKQRPAPTGEELVALMPEFKTVKVRECQVTVNKVQYGPTDDVQARLMFVLNERRVTVAYDPLDSSAVAVLTEDNRVLTVLRRKELVRMAPDDPETQGQVAAIAQMRGGLNRDARETLAGIRIAGKQLGVLQPLQLLGAGSYDAEAAPITPRKPHPAESAAPALLTTNQIAERMRLRMATKS